MKNMRLLQAIIKLKKELDELKEIKPVDGKDGKDGIDGKDGLNGKDGKNGIGIKNAYIDKKGHLILILTNNTKIDCGLCKSKDIIRTVRGGSGSPGISIVNVEIKDNHLIITLSNGKTIDAGYISGGGGGVSSYNDLNDKPTLNNVTIQGNMDLSDLGIQPEGDYVTNDKFNDTLDEIAREFATNEYVDDTIAEVSASIPVTLSDLTEDATHRVVTDNEKTTWNNKSNFSGAYNDTTGKPAITYSKAEGGTDGNVEVSTVTETIENTKSVDNYGVYKYTQLDLTQYDKPTVSDMLEPHSQLPNDVYVVTTDGNIWLGEETYNARAGEIIYKTTDEFIAIGYYACVYYMWNNETQKYEGGYFTTTKDVEDMIAKNVIIKVVSSGIFNTKNSENGYYVFNYPTSGGRTSRILVNVEGTNKYYFPYNGTMLIKNDKNIIMIGRENLIFKYDSSNNYYKQPTDIITAINSINDKYDKTGGEISGDVKIDGTLTLDIEDPDYDAGITITKALDNNLGTTMTLTGYANAEGSLSNYKPIIRNVGTPSSSYDVANKKYVDDNVVVPTYHLVFLNPDGTIDTYASTINYNTIKNNLTDPKEKDYLDVLWNTTRFYAEVVEVTDINTGDIKFIADIEYAGIPRRMVFTLNPQSVLTTTSITTGEIVSNKSQSILTDTGSIDKYTSVKAVEDFVKPVTIWETDSNFLNAIQADITENPAWQLTNLDMTPFKRIKIYSKAGKGRTTAGATGGMILEMSLDDRAGFVDYGGNFVGSVLVQKPNDANRYASLTCAVSADKTKFVVLRQTSLYGTAATTNNDIGADVFKIEGYYY